MSERVIFTEARLFDGTGSVQDGMTVAVQADRIVDVCKDEGGPRDGRVIPLAGKTLMPGMTVGHWHGEYVSIGPPLFYAGRSGTFLGTEKPPVILALQAAAALRTALTSGVTRVVSAAGAHDVDAQLQAALDQGLIDGARIIPCSRHIVTTGDGEDRGLWWQHEEKYINGIRRLGANVFVDGADQVAKAVRQEILRGAEIIKLLPSGGHGFHYDENGRNLSRAELRAAIETAHDRGVRVRAHATGKAMIMECLDLGLDIVDHGDFLDEEVIARMVKQGTFFVPSLAFSKMMTGFATDEPSPTIDPIMTAWDNMKIMLPKANAAGVKLVPGDDYGSLGMEHEVGIYGTELEIYVKEFGIPTADVLCWATRNGAELALEGDETGTIAVGKRADLIVVNGDPVADISVLTDPLRNLDVVMTGGRFFKDRLDGSTDLAAVRGLMVHRGPLEMAAE